VPEEHIPDRVMPDGMNLQTKHAKQMPSVRLFLIVMWSKLFSDQSIYTPFNSIEENEYMVITLWILRDTNCVKGF
jgi:hypothetical protein